MTKENENFIQSSLNQTPEQAEKEKKHRESQIKAEKKKSVKKKKVKIRTGELCSICGENILYSKGVPECCNPKCKQQENSKIDKLTDKEEAYARQYLVCRSKSDAYRYAYSTDNMKSETVNRNGWEVYNRPRVYNRIMELQEESNERIDISVDRIKQGYGKLAFTDLPGIVNLNKGILTMSEFNNLTASQRFCIKKFKVKTEMRLINEVEMKCEFVEVELYDKKSALDSLSKINGLFIDKSEVSVSGHIMNFSGEDKGVL